jgi:hypothetical protein
MLCGVLKIGSFVLFGIESLPFFARAHTHSLVRAEDVENVKHVLAKRTFDPK